MSEAVWSVVANLISFLFHAHFDLTGTPQAVNFFANSEDLLFWIYEIQMLNHAYSRERFTQVQTASKSSLSPP